jgi:hypothetical protein
VQKYSDRQKEHFFVKELTEGSIYLDNIVWLDIDLTYPSKAKEAAEFILAREQRLDILSTYDTVPILHLVSQGCLHLHAVNNAAK